MKRKTIINIIFLVIMIIFLLVTISFNNDFKDIHNKVIINNKETLENNVDKKFVTLDLSKANVTRLNVIKDEEYNTYILSYNDVDVLVELTKGTVAIGELDVMKMSDQTPELDLKATFNEEEQTTFIKGYYTNKNLSSNVKTINIIVYATYGFIGLLVIFIIIEIVMYVKRKNNTINE